MFDCFADELLRRVPFARASGAEDQPVCEHRRRDRLHVVRQHVVAPVGERPRLRHAQERDPGARARAEVEPLVAPRLADEVDDVAVRLGSTKMRVASSITSVIPVGVRDRLERVERRVARLLRSIRASWSAAGSRCRAAS